MFLFGSFFKHLGTLVRDNKLGILYHWVRQEIVHFVKIIVFQVNNLLFILLLFVR